VPTSRNFRCRHPGMSSPVSENVLKPARRAAGRFSKCCRFCASGPVTSFGGRPRSRTIFPVRNSSKAAKWLDEEALRLYRRALSILPGRRAARRHHSAR